MQRLSVSQFSSFRWSLFQDVVKYSRFGFRSIGLWRQKVDEFGAEETADLLFEMQMNASSLSWAGGFTGSAGHSYKFAVEDAIEAIYQAHMVGSPKLILHPGARNGHTNSHAMRLLRSGLTEIVPVAQDLGVQLLLEPVSARKSQWSFINQYDDYRQLVDDFNESELGLVIDLFHVGNNRSFLQQLPQFANRVELVQLTDAKFSQGQWKRCRFGSGQVPISLWLNQLSENGFSGDFEIEMHGDDFENADYNELLIQSQSYLASASEKIVSSIHTN